MCRNIKVLFNFDPPATDEEIKTASAQFVRKISGSSKPSKINQAAFDLATEEIVGTVRALLDELVTAAEPRNREIEKAKTQERAAKRFGNMTAAIAPN